MALLSRRTCRLLLRSAGSSSGGFPLRPDCLCPAGLTALTGRSSVDRAAADLKRGSGRPLGLSRWCLNCACHRLGLSRVSGRRRPRHLWRCLRITHRRTPLRQRRRRHDLRGRGSLGLSRWCLNYGCHRLCLPCVSGRHRPCHLWRCLRILHRRTPLRQRWLLHNLRR